MCYSIDLSKSPMKILIAGSFKHYVYEESCATALEKLGCEVIRFPWQQYYGKGVFFKIQQRWLDGPGIIRLNRDILQVVSENQPNVVFVNRGVPILPDTLEKIKTQTHALLISNNNDDPFGKEKGRRLWKHFVNSIPIYDLNFVYRTYNIQEYFEHGAKLVEVLMPYFDPRIHYPITLDKKDRLNYTCDVVFIGTAKNDVRLNFLKRLSKTKYRFRLYGQHWKRFMLHCPWLRGHYFPPIWGLEYTRAIRAAKLGLVFFSKGNRDTYTRRSFEIPAIGTCMLSERTDDMLGLFRENMEAVYFSSPQEMIEKIDWLLQDDMRRLKIAQNAMNRVHEIGGSVDERMKQVLRAVTPLTKFVEGGGKPCM